LCREKSRNLQTERPGKHVLERERETLRVNNLEEKKGGCEREGWNVPERDSWVEGGTRVKVKSIIVRSGKTLGASGGGGIAREEVWNQGKKVFRQEKKGLNLTV